MSFQLLRWFLCFVFSCLPPSHFIVLALTDITYDVQLTLEPSIGIKENALSSFDMYSKYGQKFMCHIPDVRILNQTAEHPQLNSSYVRSLLGMDNRSSCMLLKKDWWTYELCPYRHVKQFHQNGRIRDSEILLGLFESESKWDDPINMTVQTALKHKQWYNNGSTCDITYLKRNVEVRYECAAVDVPGIMKVEEVETCVYNIDVSVPALCSHPLFVTQAPTTSERIICSPATSIIREQYGTKLDIPASSSPNNFRKSNAANLFTVIRNRQSRTIYRIIKRLMRNFLHTISYPLPNSVPFGSHDAFSRYLKNVQPDSSCFASFYSSVDYSEINQWITGGKIFITRFLALIKELAPNPASLSVRPSVPIINSLGTLLLELLRYKQKQISDPTITNLPVYQQFANASEILFQINERLKRHLDANLTARLEKDLQSMYLDPEFSSSTTSLQTVCPDRITPVSIGLATKKRAPLCWTPVEALELYEVVHVIKKQMRLVHKMQELLHFSEQTRAMESMFASTLTKLIKGSQFRVVVVRGVEDADNSQDPNGLANNFDTDSLLPLSVLAMVKKAIGTASPESSDTLEVYEGFNVQGVASVFIVSAEDKRKEERRMKTMEQAYNYMASNRPAENH